MTKPAATTKPDRAVSSASNAQPVSQSSAVPQVPADMPVIKVTPGQVGGVTCLVVDARELHTALGSKRDFTTWLKARVNDYKFSIGEDYDRVDSPFESNQDAKTHGGDRKSQKYTLTLDMAKEISMLEKNDIGRAVRKYFIQCEKQLLSAESTKLQPQQTGKATENFDEKNPNKLLDRYGREFEKSPVQRHAMNVVWLLVEIPRKKAYEEYARTLAIVGENEKRTAEKVAECLYIKTLNETAKEFFTSNTPTNDLSLLDAFLKNKIQK